MTDNQWNEIVRHVRSELESRKEFVIFHHDFVEMFGLSESYYQEMVRRAEQIHPGFYFRCPIKTVQGEPFDSIRFYIPE